VRWLFAIVLAACSSSPTSGSDLATPNGDLAMPAFDLAPRSTVGIACGADACAATAQFCCTSTNGSTGKCYANPQIAQCGMSEFYCDGPEDCQPAQPICCVSNGIAQCASACAAPDVAMCHSATDCGGGACCPAPGGVYALCLSHC
jgi:hypothetical protein